MRYTIGFFLLASLSFKAQAASETLARMMARTETNAEALRTATTAAEGHIRDLAAERRRGAALTASLTTAETEKAAAIAVRDALAGHLITARSAVVDLTTDAAATRRIVGAVSSPDPRGTVAAHVEKALAVKSAARRSAEVAEREAQEGIARKAKALEEAAARSAVKNRELTALQARLKELEASLAAKDKDSAVVMNSLAEATAAAAQARRAAMEARSREEAISADLALAHVKAADVTPLRTRITALEAEAVVVAGRFEALQKQYAAQVVELTDAKNRLRSIGEAAATAAARVKDLELQLADATSKSATDAALIESITKELEEAKAANRVLISNLSAAQAEVAEKVSANTTLTAALEVARTTFEAQERDLTSQLTAAHTRVRDIQRELSSEVHRHGLTKGALSALQTRMQEVTIEHTAALAAKTAEIEASVTEAKREAAVAQEAEITRITRVHVAQLAEAESAYAAQVATLTEDQTIALETLRRKHEADIRTMADAHTQALEDAAMAAKARLDAIEHEHQAQLNAAKEEQEKLAARIIVLESINADTDRQLDTLRKVELPRLLEQQTQLLQAQYIAQTAALSLEHTAALQAEREAKAALDVRFSALVRTTSEKEATLSGQIAEKEEVMAATTAAFKKQEAALVVQINGLQAANEASTVSAADLSEQIRKAQEELAVLRDDHRIELQTVVSAAEALQNEMLTLQASHAAETKRLHEALEASSVQLTTALAAYTAEKADLEMNHAAALGVLRGEKASYEEKMAGLLAAIELTKDDAQKTHAKNTIVLAASAVLEERLERQEAELQSLTVTLVEREATLTAQRAALTEQTHTFTAQAAELVKINDECAQVTAALASVQTALTSLRAQHEASEEIVRKLTFDREAMRAALVEVQGKSTAQTREIMTYMVKRRLLEIKLASFEEALHSISKMIDGMSSREDDRDFGDDTSEDRPLYAGSAEISITPIEVFDKVTEYYSKVIRKLTAALDGSAPLEVMDEDLSDELDALLAAPIDGTHLMALSRKPADLAGEAAHSAAVLSAAPTAVESAARLTAPAPASAPDAMDMDAVIDGLLSAPMAGINLFGAGGIAPLTSRDTRVNITSPSVSKPVIGSLPPVSGSPTENSAT